MDDEKLISLVRSFEHIYNKQSPEFKNAKKKTEAWLRISSELDSSAEKCIRRWYSLRDQYTRECRSKLSSSIPEQRTWHLSESMSFLKPHIQSRCRTKNKTESVILSADTALEESNDFMIPFPPEQSLKNKNPLNSSPVDFVESHEWDRGSGSKKRKINDVDSAFCEAVNCFKELCERENSKKNTVVDGFGQMFMAVLSGMSAAKQRKTIKLVTELVMKIKDEPE